MPMKRSLILQKGTNPSRPPFRVGHRFALDLYQRSSFLNGMARVIDVGGCLRKADAKAARRSYRELIEELAHSSVDVVMIGRDWDAVGQDFQFAVGTAVDRGALTEAAYE